jgi:3-hydroxy-5-methyl-1-naphthoate 3-O-methyltransferase
VLGDSILPSSRSTRVAPLPMPRVSVVVSHFDRQSLLVEALESIASQTYRDFEVVVVNDHGADSRALVEGFATRIASAPSPFAVRYDYLPDNRGVAAARNRGVALAGGELIAYLDDDDLWRPDHLRDLVGLLDAQPECPLVYGDAEICRMERLECTEGEHTSWRCAESRTLAVPFDREVLAQDGFIVPGAMVHRRSLYEAVGPFDESLHVSDDWEWLLRAAGRTTFLRWPRIVITVRIWPDRANLSARFDARRLAALAEIERRHRTSPLEPKTFWEVAATFSGRTAPRPASPARLLELATGYQRSRILFAFIELDLATLLAESPRSTGEIAASLGADPIAADRFLDACVGLELVARDGGRFRNTPDAARYLVRGARNDLRSALGHYERRSRRAAWSDLTNRLRTWRPGATRDGHVADDDAAGAEILDQHHLSLLTGEALGRVLDLSTKRRLADLGGGTAGMSIALCRRFPDLRSTLLERPAVVPLARACVTDSGLEQRIEVLEGDFIEAALPEGCDAVLLANVLSMLCTATTRALFRRLFAELPACGLVALSGWMPEDDRAGHLLPVLLALEDIALGASDVEHSAATYAEWLAQAGFEGIETSRYYDPATLVAGRRPA